MGRFTCSFLGVVIVVIVLFHHKALGQNQGNIKEEILTVTIKKPEHGNIKVSPSIPEDCKVASGTVITIKAKPDDGYILDSIYYYNPGEGRWRMYYESMDSVMNIKIERDKVIGASFIEEEALDGFTVTQNIVYAQPGVKKLKYDVFSSEGVKHLPCIVIIHGGGWSANTEDIMRGLARELVKSGDYVVVSIDYRWIGTKDGDSKPNTMADLIEDIYGAIAHIQEHAEEYGGDPAHIAITGDSAGGHLSAAAINMTHMIGDGGFGEQEGIYEFRPTYVPQGKSIEQIRREITEALQAAAPSYGVFDSELIKNFVGERSDSWMKAISPIDNIPDITERAVPQLLLRGTNDMLIKDEHVQAYADSLNNAGQRVTYIQVEGAYHAFFDWKPDAQTKATFEKYGVPYAAKMKSFFDSVFYLKK